MKLILIVEQLRLMDLEVRALVSMRKILTGEPEKDREGYLDLAGRTGAKAWQEGLECCLTIRGKKYRHHQMPDRIIGNLDSRALNTFREASEILVIRERRRHGERDREQFLAEYVRALGVGIRAIIHDAAGAAMIYGKRL